MTKQEKIRLLDEWEKKWEREREASNSLKHIVYCCSDCHFKIAVTDRNDPYIQCSVGFHYEYDEFTEKYKKVEHINKAVEHYSDIRRLANHVCLNCGKPLSNFSSQRKIRKCNKCGGNEIVFWKELAGKHCPICKGKLDDGIVFNTNDEYSNSNWEEEENELFKAQEKYGIVNKDLYTEEEIRERDEKYPLMKPYMRSRFVVESNSNVIKFSCRRSFHYPFYIIVEWDTNAVFGKLVYCSFVFSEGIDNFKEMLLEKEKIDKLLQILDKYKFFSYPNESAGSGFDGSTWELEVSYEDLYKEISIWSPEKGVIYDIGHLLLAYSNPKIDGKIL